jgi:hypothetical protein
MESIAEKKHSPMRWFKHYSDASDGLSLKTLWSNKDYEAIAVFWRLLELLSKHNSNDGVLTANWSFLSRETGMKPTKCRRVLARISAVSLVRYEHETDEIQPFLVPKWPEFQETRGKKKVKSFAKVPGEDRREKIEDRYKNIYTKDEGEISKGTDSANQVPTKKILRVSKTVGSDKVIAVYCAEYKSRYQARPEIDGKTIGLINSLLKTHSFEKLSELIKTYLKMDDPWFKTKNHDFSTFRENLTKISTAMQTGSNLSAEPKRPKIYHEELWKSGGDP